MKSNQKPDCIDLICRIVELAKEVEAEDPIDWDLLPINKNNAYELMALHVVELFSNNDELTTKATIVKLLVENFVLNLKLQIINNENS